MPPCCLYLALPKHVMRNVSTAGRYHLSALPLMVEIITVTSALVVVCKIRCMFFFTAKTYAL